MPLTHQQWMTLTKKTFGSRSGALQDVDTWLLRFENSGHNNQKYLDSLAQAFDTWSKTKQKTEMVGNAPKVTWTTGRIKKKEQGTGKNAIELMQEFLVSHQVSNIVHKQQATGLTERVAIVQRENSPFTTSEGARVQEGIRELQAAVRAARDELIAAKSGGGARQMYVKWFGAWDATRARTVLDRFQTLDKICTAKGIAFTDGRDDPEYAPAFAWAFPGFEENFPNMWLGEAFFRKRIGGGRDAVSGTLGTLVHELTHACFHTADVPHASRIASGVAQDQWGNEVNPPNGYHVCNDPKNDCRLAELYPAETLRNADNYGEFVVDVHTRAHFTYAWP